MSLYRTLLLTILGLQVGLAVSAAPKEQPFLVFVEKERAQCALHNRECRKIENRCTTKGRGATGCLAQLRGCSFHSRRCQYNLDAAAILDKGLRPGAASTLVANYQKACFGEGFVPQNKESKTREDCYLKCQKVLPLHDLFCAPFGPSKYCVDGMNCADWAYQCENVKPTNSGCIPALLSCFERKELCSSSAK